MDSGFSMPCLNMIRRLRLEEEILLYGNLLTVTTGDMDAVRVFLQAEFEKEALDFPLGAPAFDPNAAGWAAKTAYLAAQLILYRENKPEHLDSLLPPYDGEVHASAIVSADLCFRFLSPMVQQLKLIDTEDALIPILENHLHQWHYSGISHALKIETLDFNTIVSDPCLYTLYCNRIISQRKLPLAQHDLFVHPIRAAMGIYGNELWKEFNALTHSKVV